MTESISKTSRSSVMAALIIGLKLLLICAIVAGVVSGVNGLTNERYLANLNEQKRQAIIGIFGSETLQAELLTPEEDTEAVYAVTDNGVLLGYCVETSAVGYGGDIVLSVGFSADRSIKGVSIVSLNETPGLGAKVQEPSYLEQYTGKSGELVLREDVSAVAGATISSKAVLEAVNRAGALLNACVAGGVQ